MIISKRSAIFCLKSWQISFSIVQFWSNYGPSWINTTLLATTVRDEIVRILAHGMVLPNREFAEARIQALVISGLIDSALAAQFIGNNDTDDLYTVGRLWVFFAAASRADRGPMGYGTIVSFLGWRSPLSTAIRSGPSGYRRVASLRPTFRSELFTIMLPSSLLPSPERVRGHPQCMQATTPAHFVFRAVA